MRIIEITALDNGAHRNQTGSFSTVPEGWAVIPEDMETENFPFGDITAEKVDEVPIVTAWTPGVMPEPEEKAEPEPTSEELLDILLGVSSNE